MPLPYSEGKHTLSSVNAYKLYKLGQCFYYYSHPWAKPTFLRQRKGELPPPSGHGPSGRPQHGALRNCSLLYHCSVDPPRGVHRSVCQPKAGLCNWKGMRG